MRRGNRGESLQYLRDCNVILFVLISDDCEGTEPEAKVTALTKASGDTAAKARETEIAIDDLTAVNANKEL
jgi:hypothetical protein